jgi:hypothetical protein
MAEKFVLVIEMSTKHFGRLINGMLNLDRHSGTGLGLLDQLEIVFNKQSHGRKQKNNIRPESCG